MKVLIFLLVGFFQLLAFETSQGLESSSEQNISENLFSSNVEKESSELMVDFMHLLSLESPPSYRDIRMEISGEHNISNDMFCFDYIKNSLDITPEGAKLKDFYAENYCFDNINFGTEEEAKLKITSSIDNIFKMKMNYIENVLLTGVFYFFIFSIFIQFLTFIIKMMFLFIKNSNPVKSKKSLEE